MGGRERVAGGSLTLANISHHCRSTLILYFGEALDTNKPPPAQIASARAAQEAPA